MLQSPLGRLAAKLTRVQVAGMGSPFLTMRDGLSFHELRGKNKNNMYHSAILNF